MTNYYEKLNLDRSLSTQELNRELARLENLWIHRSINAPEKALVMQCLIAEARTCFADDNTRREYDRQLDNDGRDPEPQDPGPQPNQAFDKWVADASQYAHQGQYDLAESALEQATRCMQPQDEDSVFYALASEIYRNRLKLETALNCINKAIVLDPDEAFLYLGKARILFDFSQSPKIYEESQRLTYIAQYRDTLAIVIQKAQDPDVMAAAAGKLALSFYTQEPKDETKASGLAATALEIGPNEDASQVLQDILRRKQKEKAFAEEQLRRKELAAQEAEKRRKEAAEAEERRRQEEQRRQAEQNRINAERHRRQNLKPAYKVLACIGILIGAVIIFMLVLFLIWNYNEFLGLLFLLFGGGIAVIPVFHLIGGVMETINHWADNI